MPVMWDDRYATGVKEIDDQHKDLFDAVNKLEAIVGKGELTPAIDRLMQFLETYVITHFKYEENCMRKYKCPMHEKNIAAHKAFLEFFGEFKKEYEASDNKLMLLQKLYTYAANWLVGHICKVDTKLKDSVAVATS